MIRTHDLKICSLNHCTTLLVNVFGKEANCKATLAFIVYFDKYYITTLRCPIPHLKRNDKAFATVKKEINSYFKKIKKKVPPPTHNNHPMLDHN